MLNTERANINMQVQQFGAKCFQLSTLECDLFFILLNLVAFFQLFMSVIRNFGSKNVVKCAKEVEKVFDPLLKYERRIV